MIEQMYAAAVRSSDLSVKAHKMGHADVIAAFGMSRSVLGLALLRLHTEWDGSEVRDGREVSSVEIRALRSFPVVRLGLMDWLAKQKGVTDPCSMACAVVGQWLNRLCPNCKGSGEVMHDKSARTCPVCKGLKVRRESSNPVIRAALNHIDDCTQSARSTAKRRLYGSH